jgi:hypothetical protein
MITSTEASQRAQEHLQGFPAHITDAYLAFAASREPARLDEAVLGLLQFYLPQPPKEPLTTLPGSTRLREDLGVDSLTMIDMVFLAESLFAIKLGPDELGQIATLDELRGHFRRLICGACEQEA